MFSCFDDSFILILNECKVRKKNFIHKIISLRSLLYVLTKYVVFSTLEMRAFLALTQVLRFSFLVKFRTLEACSAALLSVCCRRSLKAISLCYTLFCTFLLCAFLVVTYFNNIYITIYFSSRKWRSERTSLGSA